MGQNHSRNRRQQRHNEALLRTPRIAQDQIAELNYRLGENQGAKKERAKLAKQIAKVVDEEPWPP